MVKKHIKRLSAPKSWPIARKERTWVTRPKPGKAFNLAISLSNVLKELTGVARTSKEARYILRYIGVTINGKKATSTRQPVGFMDVVAIDEKDQFFRIGLTKKGRLCAVSIDKTQAEKRLVKIKNKTRVAGKIQINCTDGTNILVDKDTYSTGDSLLLDQTSIKKHLPLEKGATVIMVSGSHLSEIGTVQDIDHKTITFTYNEETHSTATSCAFVIGKDEAEVIMR